MTKHKSLNQIFFCYEFLIIRIWRKRVKIPTNYKPFLSSLKIFRIVFAWITDYLALKFIYFLVSRITYLPWLIQRAMFKVWRTNEKLKRKLWYINIDKEKMFPSIGENLQNRKSPFLENIRCVNLNLDSCRQLVFLLNVHFSLFLPNKMYFIDLILRFK
jgi:hypothetical protein